jgi:hypothetical protein
MNVKLDAITVEIVRNLDSDLLKHDSNFENLWRPNRVHIIVSVLVRRGVVQATKPKRGTVPRWRSARRLENCAGATSRGISDEVERIEAPIGMNTLADEFFEFLEANGEVIEEIASNVLRCFKMYRSGLLEYRGKKNGLCQFYRSSTLYRSAGRRRYS